MGDIETQTREILSTSINVDNELEVIYNKETKLNEKSERYISNKKAILIAEKFEKEFKNIGKTYDINLAINKKGSPLYYIIFGENVLDIGLEGDQLEGFFLVLKDGFAGIPIMGRKELEKYSIPEKSKIGNFIREVAGKKFNDPLYNRPSDGTEIKKSTTEKNIEQESRKLIIGEISYDGKKYLALQYGKNIIFGLKEIKIKNNSNFSSLAVGNNVLFDKERTLQITKDVIEGRRNINSIKNDEIMEKIKKQSRFEVPIAEQKKYELERFKGFLNACIKLKEYQSYPIAFNPK